MNSAHAEQKPEALSHEVAALPPITERQISPPGATIYVKGVGPGRVLRATSDDGFLIQHPRQEPAKYERDVVVEPARRFDYMRPAADAPSRQVSTLAAVFSLLSTMMGGGVLSLPSAFRASGLILAVLATLGSALASAFTIDLLIGASRATGADSYELMAKRAFGRKGRVASTSLTVGLIWLCMVAYLVLLADLMQPVVGVIIPSLKEQVYGIRTGVICGCVAVMSPLCFRTSLNALRFMSVIAFAALCVVVIALLHHAASSYGVDHDAFVMSDGHEHKVTVHAASVSLWPESFNDALYVFPIFGLSFLCHFNVLPMHSEMRDPTRARTKRVAFSAMSVCSVLYLIAGTAGYLFAGPWTCGNILLNFASSDVLVNVARVALSVALVGTFPLFVLPCRANLHQLFGDCTRNPARQPSDPLEHSLASGAPPINGTLEEAPSNVSVHVYDRGGQHGSFLDAVGHFVPLDEVGQALSWSNTSFALETVGLVCSAVFSACVLDSVLIVWTVAGSTLAFMIAFTFPCLMWLKLHSHLAPPCKVMLAKLVLAMSILLAIGCTIEVVINIKRPVCPKP